MWMLHLNAFDIFQKYLTFSFWKEETRRPSRFPVSQLSWTKTRLRHLPVYVYKNVCTLLSSEKSRVMQGGSRDSRRDKSNMDSRDLTLFHMLVSNNS